MKLIIGGKYQGKLIYALELTGLTENDVYDAGKTFILNNALKAKIINNFNILIKNILNTEEDIYSFVYNLLEKNPDVVIISNEIGYGVVPIDKAEREYREIVGKVCCVLAKKANMVTRVVCGIGKKIK